MFISDKPDAKRQAARTGFSYLLWGIFCAAAGAIYEHFSHEVYSFYMLYAFAFPLVGGALPFAALALSKSTRMPARVPALLYHFGIAALTVGSVMRGVLDIYGTESVLISVYWYAGAALTAVGILLYAAGLYRAEK